MIAREIRANGPIGFGRFMELALYHPDLGYYTGKRDPFGREGDFFTNAQLQPVFGRLIAQQIDAWRRDMGSPSGFSVVELGAGRREMEVEVRRCLPDMAWTALDVGDPWPDGPLVGVVFCNEFFDALPVDVVERRGDSWVEQRVGLERDRFVWDAAVEPTCREGLPHIAAGCRIETCERQVAQLRAICGFLECGWVLIIDYGYTREELERGGRFPAGSLMGYVRHRAATDVLREPGARDITAHVNFSALQDAAHELGMVVEPLRSQQSFLLGLGEADQFSYALSASSDSRGTQLRMQLKSLLLGLGETFRVLVLRKPSAKRS